MTGSYEVSFNYLGSWSFSERLRQLTIIIITSICRVPYLQHQSVHGRIHTSQLHKHGIIQQFII